MAEQWREILALALCYLAIGTSWLQHHYTGRIYTKSDHWFGAINLLFLFAVGVIPYNIRASCSHIGTPFEAIGAVNELRRSVSMWRGSGENIATPWSGLFGDRGSG